MCQGGPGVLTGVFRGSVEVFGTINDQEGSWLEMAKWCVIVFIDVTGVIAVICCMCVVCVVVSGSW